ncbi:MAG: hypothetical protein ACI8XB_001610 [Patiriisocius sp.]|jgi:hypothetical protein
MSIYSKKQRWKIVLLILAFLIIGASFWYSNYIVRKIRSEEHQKVELWSQAIKKRAKLVQYTQTLFEELEENEQKSVEIWTDAMDIQNNVELEDYTFVQKIIQNQVNIPMILVDDDDQITSTRNLDGSRIDDPLYVRQQLEQMKSLYPPMEIIFFNEKQYLYYKDSKLFSELKSVMDDLINTFISETVINSASVPVVLTNEAQNKVISSGNVDQKKLKQPDELRRVLSNMKLSNPPIEIDLGNNQKSFIFYEDSVILKQLKFFPLVQFLVIGLFLMISYLLFSTFRKSEQNQVWVGMAKETAHQLGTPLSALMAWMDILKIKEVDEGIINEMSKDISRLETITERFSKIGSEPDLKSENIKDVMQEYIDYFTPRTSKKVIMEMEVDEHEDHNAIINKALFGWVIENLFKNAIDAMSGAGHIHVRIVDKGSVLHLDISDSGKGVPQNIQRTVFQPGFTTKKRGWGLGLSLTKRIMETYHHGKIFILNSTIGKGTTFRIILIKKEVEM